MQVSGIVPVKSGLILQRPFLNPAKFTPQAPKMRAAGNYAVTAKTFDFELSLTVKRGKKVHFFPTPPILKRVKWSKHQMTSLQRPRDTSWRRQACAQWRAPFGFYICHL